MIEINNLFFSYKGKKLYNGLNLDLKPGIYGLLGKNGAGKSTLLKIISGQLKSEKGGCTTLGFHPFSRNPEMLGDIFFLPEAFVLPKISCKKYISLYSKFYKNFDHDFFESCLSDFGMDRTSDLTSMSYGQKKKFMISFGLASSTKILLLDEPTNGLDIPSKSIFRKLAASAGTENRVILISTHQVRDLETLIDPVIILENGKIVFSGSVEIAGEKIKVEKFMSPPGLENIIYQEKVPGGYLVAMENDTESYSAMDLEFFFNMVVCSGDKVNEILGGV